jgi:hypothetical protein
MEADFDARKGGRNDFELARSLSEAMRAAPSLSALSLQGLECRDGACKFTVSEIDSRSYEPLARSLPVLVGSRLPQMRILVVPDDAGQLRANIYLGADETRFPALQ